METFSALLALCVGNSPMTGDFRARRPVTLSFGVFFDLRLNKLWSEQWWGWWFETPSCPSWCHCNEITTQLVLMLRSEFLCVLVRCLRCWIMHSKMLHTSVQYIRGTDFQKDEMTQTIYTFRHCGTMMMCVLPSAQISGDTHAKMFISVVVFLRLKRFGCCQRKREVND